MSAKKPRGVRNCNPGNLRRSEDPWQGLAREQTDPDFFVFETPVYGIRALARTLITYQDKHGCQNVFGFISRWAPPNENDTRAYVRSVADALDVDVIDPIDVHTHKHLAPLVKAIIRHENGQQPYTDAQIDKALSLAGVEPERPKSLQSSRTVKGAQVAAAGGTVATISGVVATIEPAMPLLQQIGDFAREHPHALLIGLGIAIVLGACYALWAKIDDRRRGVA